MTTPIDTTRLRVLLAEASEPHDWSVATLAGCLRILDTDGGIVATVSEESDVRLIVAMREALPGLLDEVDRLRKIFDDAGQGEHNVLALVEHYQDCVSKSEDEVERLRARPTWERVLRIANGCTDYGGGHHGADHEVYQHGIWTVCNVLKNACEQGDKPDMQLRVVEAIGAEAMRAIEPEEGGTR
jgi:hypothetical protein